MMTSFLRCGNIVGTDRDDMYIAFFPEKDHRNWDLRGTISSYKG